MNVQRWKTTPDDISSPTVFKNFFIILFLPLNRAKTPELSKGIEKMNDNDGKREQNPRPLKNTDLVRPNQEEVPFLYITMREPSKDYKQANGKKQTLYRFIKLK